MLPAHAAAPVPRAAQQSVIRWNWVRPRRARACVCVCVCVCGESCLAHRGCTGRPCQRRSGHSVSPRQRQSICAAHERHGHSRVIAERIVDPRGGPAAARGRQCSHCSNRGVQFCLHQLISCAARGAPPLDNTPWHRRQVAPPLSQQLSVDLLYSAARSTGRTRSPGPRAPVDNGMPAARKRPGLEHHCW